MMRCGVRNEAKCPRMYEYNNMCQNVNSNMNQNMNPNMNCNIRNTQNVRNDQTNMVNDLSYIDRETLLSRLTALDFMAVDLGLYLNTHPDNKEAIAEYNRIIKAAEMLRMKYEQDYGPLCSFRSYARNPQQWQWKDCPWPWKKDFNFDVKEGCR